jgi:hypothetical protein
MQEDPDGETPRERFGHRNGCELETTGQYDEDHEAAKLRRPYSFQRASRSASLSPKKARPPATTRPIQLTHIGTDQPSIMTGPVHINPHRVEQRHRGED